MKITVFNHIVDEAVEIRKEVFENEQGFIDEFDEIDKICKHAVAFKDDLAIGTCRFFEKENKTYMLGRIAIRLQYRKHGYGSAMLNAVEAYILSKGGERAVLHAQLASKSFYEKQGYTARGVIDYEQDCPHVWMEKELA